MKGQNMHVKSGGVKQLIYVTAQKNEKSDNNEKPP